MRRLGRWVAVALAAAWLAGSFGVLAEAKTRIVVAAHYGQGQKDFLLPYFDEYMKLHPDVELVYQELTFADYLQTVLTARMAGQAPDVYHLYSLWGVQMQQNGVLDQPPADVQKLVRETYVPSAVDSVTIDGTVWGIPTEINNYMLVYNRRLLAEAGYSEPPGTWEELLKVGKAVTQKNAEGKITRAGFAIERGWDSIVVHPWMALLYSEGGQLFSDDFSQATFNSPEGVRALEKLVATFEQGLTDPNVSVWDFPTGTIAMTIMAPWYENALKSTMGERYQEIAVAPIPPGPAGLRSVQYTFYWAVDSKSRVKKEAWEFLRWLNAARDGQGSRMGQMLITLGAIPANQADIAAHPDDLDDTYTRPFVDALAYSVAEPNVVQGQEIKMVLMNYILKAYYGEMTPKQALDAAAREVDDILFEYY
ncbi:extracellular solute-binding protein [Limnochorda pilosa]|uniref:Extracellular solute-binding protein n=1 Tax=Limnochorda pilosa TaxID=1555112 RepID=A0A0K2SMF3_LIMPI|nr:extracellular solute-binding protein [Limnochorda pilosa]BAS28285.1 extracellular solute-binding protein [Limnochorda pilosa]